MFRFTSLPIKNCALYLQYNVEVKFLQSDGWIPEIGLGLKIFESKKNTDYVCAISGNYNFLTVVSMHGCSKMLWFGPPALFGVRVMQVQELD